MAKGPGLSLPSWWLLLSWGFHPWFGNFHKPRAQPEMEGERREREKTTHQELRSCRCAQWVRDPTSFQEDAGSIPGPAPWMKAQVSVRQVARLRPPALYLPYAACLAINLKKAKRNLPDFQGMATTKALVLPMQTDETSPPRVGETTCPGKPENGFCVNKAAHGAQGAAWRSQEPSQGAPATKPTPRGQGCPSGAEALLLMPVSPSCLKVTLTTSETPRDYSEHEAPSARLSGKGCPAGESGRPSRTFQGRPPAWGKGVRRPFEQSWGPPAGRAWLPRGGGASPGQPPSAPPLHPQWQRGASCDRGVCLCAGGGGGFSRAGGTEGGCVPRLDVAAFAPE